MKTLITNLLDDKIPSDVISTREGSGGKKLSYLEGWYVIDRLNKVVGIGRWYYQAIEIKKVYETSITKKDRFGKESTGRGVSYTATVSLCVILDDNNSVNFTDVGAGKGIDYGSGLEADESAVKEAVTDGLKRCAKNLGMSMGLALYDKSQENVNYEQKSEPEPSRSNVNSISYEESSSKGIQKYPKQDIATQQQESGPVEHVVIPASSRESGSKGGHGDAKQTDAVPQQDSDANELDAIRNLIRTTARVAVKKGLEPGHMKQYLADTYKASVLEELSKEQLEMVLVYINTKV